MALRDASDDMMRVSGRDGPGESPSQSILFVYYDFTHHRHVTHT